ncbi:MAG: FtsX-like permease family protein [Bacteroidota bacterium]
MLIKIAWKNIWRNKRRSAIMITAIAVGLWGGLFAVGIFTGMYDTMVNSAIDRQYGHIQIHAEGFRAERLIGMTIPGADTIAASLKALPGVSAVTERTVIDGMGSSATSNQGVTILGVEPKDERAVTAVARRMVDGTFFEGEGRLPIVIGQKLAEKLDVKLHGKLVLAFQNLDGTIVYGAFRIAGIFNTEANSFDGVAVFVRQSDLAQLMGVRTVHEIAVRLTGNDSLEVLAREIASLCPSLEIDTWKDLAPELKLAAESSDITMEIFLGIILLALLFGITNTMLMSVLDRVREFGMLMAVGMKRRRVFGMVVLETLFLSITGSAAGVASGSTTVAWFEHTGISLAWVSDGLSQYGISSTLFPVVHPVTYPVLGIMVIFAACGAAIYPALKAIHLNPASAIATYG